MQHTQRTAWAIERIRRGNRVAAIREGLALNGTEFAALIRRRLRQSGVPDRSFDKAKVSRIEGGKRDLTLEEGVAIAALDQQRHGIEWLTFGRNLGFLP
jgi:hypothetical protein